MERILNRSLTVDANFPVVAGRTPSTRFVVLKRVEGVRSVTDRRIVAREPAFFAERCRAAGHVAPGHGAVGTCLAFHAGMPATSSRFRKPAPPRAAGRSPPVATRSRPWPARSPRAAGRAACDATRSRDSESSAARTSAARRRTISFFSPSTVSRCPATIRSLWSWDARSERRRSPILRFRNPTLRSSAFVASASFFRRTFSSSSETIHPSRISWSAGSHARPGLRRRHDRVKPGDLHAQGQARAAPPPIDTGLHKELLHSLHFGLHGKGVLRRAAHFLRPLDDCLQRVPD